MIRQFRAISRVQPNNLNKDGYFIFGPAKYTRQEAIEHRDSRQQETWSVLDSVQFREITSWIDE